MSDPMGGKTASNHFLPIRQNANWNRPSARQILSILGVCFGMALIAFAFLGNKVPFGHQEEGRMSERQFAFREKRSIQNGPNEEEVREAIFASIDPGRIASTLRLITKKPHVAGTAANRRVAQNIAQIWRANGIEGWFMGKHGY